MNQKEFEAVVKLPATKRYEYFIKKIADTEELWGLYKDGWAVTQDDSGHLLIPLWPQKEFAEHCAVGEQSVYVAESINLYEFIDEWLPEMKECGHKPSIFWNNDDSAVVEIDTLHNDILSELTNY